MSCGNKIVSNCFKSRRLSDRKARDILDGKAVFTAWESRLFIAAKESRKLLLPYQILRFLVLVGK